MKLSMLYELDSKLNSSIDTSITNTDIDSDLADDSEPEIEKIVTDHRQHAEDLGVDASDDIENLYDKYKSQMEKMRQQRLDIKSAIERASQKQKEFGDTLASAQNRLDQV